MLEEKVVRRGEVWWVDAGISVGSEEKMGRPAVIVSGDRWNERLQTVIVAYLTSKPQAPTPVICKVGLRGKANRVLCHQINSVDKSRLTEKIGTLTEAEMIRIGGALAVAMCIPQYSHVEKPQPKQEEPADVIALRCERDMWQRMYEKTMEMLVDQKMKETVAQISVVQQTVAEVIEKPPVVEQKPETPPVVKQKDPVPVDINHCSELALRELGLSDADVASVIACRPFEFVLELNCVPDLDTGWVAANEHRFICTPIAPEETVTKKVNLNTCGGKDLMALGINKTAAYRITSHRKHNGSFALISDLLRVKGISQKFVDTWADKLEV